LGSELLSNEQSGEGRVGLYLGVWSAAIAGGATLGSSSAEVIERLKPLAAAAVPVLVLLGLTTLLRILKRNYQTDSLTDSLGRLRRLMIEQQFEASRIEAALPWRRLEPVSRLETMTKRELWFGRSAKSKQLQIKEPRRAVFHPGLLHVVQLANSAIPAMIAFAWYPDRVTPWVLSSIVGGVYVFQSLCIYIGNAISWHERVRRAEAFAASMKEAAVAYAK
jgi:hypothetical protein